MTELEGNKVKGYVCGCMSAICYGVNPLFSLPVMSRGVGVDSILFYRYAIAAVALAILMLVKKIDFRLKAKELIAVVIMGT
ncbi:MAG: EamA family transporter, partial [Bacteroidales bacterium]|nr:EamA family transporter [Bacteroidales bacterium]